MSPVAHAAALPEVANAIEAGESAEVVEEFVEEDEIGVVKANGSVAATYRYTDFGGTETVTDTGFDNVLCYTGSVYDKATGLYYLNARYYDPETANFLSQDTYRGEREDCDQWNLYAYCAGDPVDHVDPSGHDAIVLRSSFPVVGHLAIIVQSKKHSGKWYYFSYDDSGWSGKKIKENVTKYVDNRKKRIKKGFNKRTGRSGKSCRGANYEKSLFIRGNFSKSYKYIKKQKRIKETGRNPEFDNYGFTTYNCSWMAVYVLSKGRNKYRKMFKEMLYVKNEKEGKKAVRTHIPNVIFHEISKVCGVKPVSVPR